MTLPNFESVAVRSEKFYW